MKIRDVPQIHFPNEIKDISGKYFSEIALLL